MTSHALARTAYSQSSVIVAEPKRIEYAAFARVTKMLMQAADMKNTNPVSLLASALHDNRRLWIAIAGLVAEDENALPKELRARLFYLSEFVTHHSIKVLNREADVKPLIEVNHSVMAGLNVREVSK